LNWTLCVCFAWDRKSVVFFACVCRFEQCRCALLYRTTVLVLALRTSCTTHIKRIPYYTSSTVTDCVYSSYSTLRRIIIVGGGKKIDRESHIYVYIYIYIIKNNTECHICFKGRIIMPYLFFIFLLQYRHVQYVSSYMQL
jgi:hypothetical protein